MAGAQRIVLHRLQHLHFELRAGVSDQGAQDEGARGPAAQNKSVLVFLREYQAERLLCVNNLSRYSQYAELDLSKYRGKTPVDVWSGKSFPTIGDLPYLMTLGPHGVFWFQIVDQPRRATKAG